MSFRSAATLMLQGDCPGQEDHALVREEKGIFVLADGFGGPQSGARASREACEALLGFLVKEAGDMDATLPFEIRSYFSLAGNVLFNGLVHANRKVNAANRGKSVHEKGGASVIAGYLDDGLLALANVGSCSAWIFRKGKAGELATPRSYARLRDPVSRETAHWRQVPLMALGTAGDLEPEIVETRVEKGDWILLQTTPVHPEGVQRLEQLQARAPELRGEPVVRALEEEVTALGRLSRNSSYVFVFI